MKRQAYQHPELRDANDSIIQDGLLVKRRHWPTLRAPDGLTTWPTTWRLSTMPSTAAGSTWTANPTCFIVFDVSGI